MLRLQETVALIPLDSFFRLTLIESEDDTRRVGAIFVGLFLTLYTHCHAKLRAWGYILIAASQPGYASPRC